MDNSPAPAIYTEGPAFSYSLVQVIPKIDALGHVERRCEVCRKLAGDPILDDACVTCQFPRCGSHMTSCSVSCRRSDLMYIHMITVHAYRCIHDVEVISEWPPNHHISAADFKRQCHIVIQCLLRRTPLRFFISK